MYRVAPKDWDLAHTDTIWARPGEEVVLTMDFGEDVSEWTFTLLYEERGWSYAPYSYDSLEPGSIEDGFEFFPNEYQIEGAMVQLVLDEELIEEWLLRTVEIRLKVNNGSRIWIADDRVITVASGD